MSSAPGTSRAHTDQRESGAGSEAGSRARWYRRLRWLLLLLAAVVLFGNLGDKIIVHSDEGHYVGAALTAHETGEWVVPLRSGRFNRDYGKPPLGYLVMSASIALFGPSKTSFRLPFAFAGLALVALVLVLGDRLCLGAGLVAAVALLASPGWAENVRRIWLETLVVGFDLAAILLYWQTRARRPLRGAALAGALLALALLTKQVAGIFGLAAIVAAEAATLRPSWRRLGLVGCIALVPLLAWALLLYHRVGDEAGSLWTFHVIQGVVEGHRHQPRKPFDYFDAWVQYLGWPGALLGIVGGIVGVVLLVRWRGERGFLVRALLAYLLGSLVVVGLWSKSFRFWYPFPAAYAAVLLGGTGLALFAAWLPGRFGWLRIGLWLAIVGYLGWGWVTSVQHNVLEAPSDPMQRMAQELRDANLDRIVAESPYFREEFLYYLAGLELTEVPRGKACGQPPPGERWAFLALNPPPLCWKELSGRHGRVYATHYYLAEPMEEP